MDDALGDLRGGITPSIGGVGTLGCLEWEGVDSVRIVCAGCHYQSAAAGGPVHDQEAAGKEDVLRSAAWGFAHIEKRTNLLASLAHDRIWK